MKLLCPAMEETDVTDFASATPFILDKSQLRVNISFEMPNVSDDDAAFVEHALKTVASLCEDLNRASLATVNDIVEAGPAAAVLLQGVFPSRGGQWIAVSVDTDVAAARLCGHLG